MSFANQTAFAALPVPTIDAQGHDVLAVLVKGTYLVDRAGSVRPAPDPSPVRVSDEVYEPDSPRTSARFPSDLGFQKRGADVVLQGDAIAPAKVTSLDVAVKVQDRIAPLRVHGPRVYFSGAFGMSISAAQPFERVPIVYERAYGGMTDDASMVELANPAGVGVARRPSDLEHRPAPQIEHPARPHTSASDRHPPMGYGALMSHWAPRMKYAGTFDDRWRATRLPILPEDYDIRFGNVAHPSLQLDDPLAPGDPVAVTGMSLAPLAFALPDFRFAARARFDDGSRAVLTPPIDLLLLQPELGRFELLGRAVFPIGRGRRVLREVVVTRDA
ncbi:MAG: DUF2169 domain-containing protein [Byssovorax sp.]